MLQNNTTSSYELDEYERENFLRHINNKTISRYDLSTSDKNIANGAFITPVHTISSSLSWLKRSLIILPETEEKVYVSGCNLIVMGRGSHKQTIIPLKSDCEVTSLFYANSIRGRLVLVGEKVRPPIHQKDNKNYPFTYFGRVEVINIDKQDKKFIDHSYFLDYDHFIYDVVVIADTELCMTIVKNIDVYTNDTKIMLWQLENNALIDQVTFNHHIESIVFNENNKFEFIFFSTKYFGIWKYSKEKKTLACIYESVLKDREISDVAFIEIGEFKGVAIGYYPAVFEIYNRNNDMNIYRKFQMHEIYQNIYKIAAMKQSSNSVRKAQDFTTRHSVTKTMTETIHHLSEESIIRTNELLENSPLFYNATVDNFAKDLALKINQTNMLNSIIVRGDKMFMFFDNSQIILIFGLSQKDQDNFSIKLIRVDKLKCQASSNCYLNINENLTRLIHITEKEILSKSSKFIDNIKDVRVGLNKREKKKAKNEKGEKKIYTTTVFKKNYLLYQISFENDIPVFQFQKDILRGSCAGTDFKNMVVSENPRYIISGFDNCLKVNQQYGLDEINSYDFASLLKSDFTNYDSSGNTSLHTAIQDQSHFKYINKIWIDVKLVLVSPQANLIFVSYKDSVCLYSIMDKEIIEVAKIKSNSTCAAFSQSGMYLAYGWEEYENEFSIIVLNSGTYEVEYMIKKVPMPIKITWFDNDRKIAVLFNDTTTNIVGWELYDKRLIEFIPRELNKEMHNEEKKKQRKKEMVLELSGRSDTKILDFAYDEVFDYLLITNNDRWAKIYTPKSNDEVKVEFQLDCIYYVILLIRKLDIVIFGTSEGSIRILLWPISNFSFKQQIDHPEYTEKYLHSDKIVSLQVCRDLKFLYSAAADGSVFVSSIHSYNNESELNINSLLYFNNDNILTKKVQLKYSDLICLTEPIYQGKINQIANKKTDISKLESEFQTNKEKVENDCIKEIKDQRDEINAEIDNITRNLKSLQDKKESKHRALKQKRDRQKEAFKEEKERIKGEYKKEKEKLQIQTKNLNRLIEEANKQHSEAMENIGSKQKLENENIKRNLEEINKNLAEKLKQIEYLIDIKKKTFQTEIKQVENKYETVIREYESTIKSENERIKDEINQVEKATAIIENTNKNYNDKIKEWQAHLKDLKTNNGDLIESYLFNSIKLKHMEKQLKENEKLISENEGIAKQKRSVNDRLEQLRYVLEYQIKNLIKEKTPIEEQIKNFEVLHKDFNIRFKLLNIEQTKIDDFTLNNETLIKEFKKELVDKNTMLYTLKSIFRAVDIEIHKIFKSNIEHKDEIIMSLRNILGSYLKNDFNDEDVSAHITLEKKLQSKLIEREIKKQKNRVFKDLITSRQALKNVRKEKDDIMLSIRLENNELIKECSNIRNNLEKILKNIVDIEKKFIELTSIHKFLNLHMNTKMIREDIRVAKQSIMLGEVVKTKIAKGNFRGEDSLINCILFLI